MIAALSIIANIIVTGRGSGVTGFCFSSSNPTISITTTVNVELSNQHNRLRRRRLVYSSFDGNNNDWVIDDDNNDDDGLGDYAKSTTKTTMNNRISENQRKRERRKRNDVLDNNTQNNNKNNNMEMVNNDVEEENGIRYYFATCIPGLHETLANELRTLGAMDVVTNGKSGVQFVGSTHIGMKILLWCRTAHRVMELVASSSTSNMNDNDDDFVTTSGIRNRDDLYHFIRSTSAVHIPSLLGNGSGGLLTLSVSTIYAGSIIPKELSHSHFTALTVKNALVDAVREMREDGSRPDVNVIDSDVPLVLVLRGRKVDHHGGDDRGGGGGGGRRRQQQQQQQQRGYNRSNSNKDDIDEWEIVTDVDLYRCLHSGGSLHRRGYRRLLDNNNKSFTYRGRVG
jgi:hypothetical protein